MKEGYGMQVYLIRHGTTAGNLERRYVGTTDEPLTERAIRALRAARESYPLPDSVFASPMKRCVQTAELLFPERQAEICDDLRECAFGEFEYKNYQELQGDNRYQAWIDSGGMLAFPGGESLEMFADRCCAAFEACIRSARARENGSIAFVVHGGTIMAILDRYSSPHRDYFDWQAANAGGFLCELLPKGKVEESGTEAKESVAKAERYSLKLISVLPSSREWAETRSDLPWDGEEREDAPEQDIF